MSISINLTTEEMELVESYSKFHGTSVIEAFKRALLEKIEDEYDIALAEEAHNKYVESGRKSRPIQEFWDELEEEGLM